MAKMAKSKKSLAYKLLALALVLIFVGFIGASLVQSSGGKIEVQELYYETPLGMTANAMLFKPENATAETPAPCIVLMHGWYNNKEMQDVFFTEYARRGYVVISVNQYSHGDSDKIGIGYEYDGGNGMYDAVVMASQIPYVDSSRIAVSGHSFGSDACTYACWKDDLKGTNLISACLLICSDPQYTVNMTCEGSPRVIYLPAEDPDGFCNAYGSRDVAVVACQYDEFYHACPDDSYPAGYTPPRDYMHTIAAQSFLHFGIDPTGLDERQAGVFYTQEIDGKEAIRAVYNPAITHPAATENSGVVAFGISFFEKALPAPNPLPANDQVWQWKAVFNAISLAGLIMFLGSFTIAMLDSRYFSELKSKEEVHALAAPAGAGKLWYWGGMLIAALFAMFTYAYLFTPLENSYTNLYNLVFDGNAPFFKQWPVTFIGVWSALCGLFMALIMFLNYKAFGRKNGFDLRERGVCISWQKLWKTVLLSLLVVFSGYLLIFIGDWMFESDARIWVIAVRAFKADKLVEVCKYLPLFIIYYVCMSVSVNCFNFVKNGKPWVNVLIQCVAVLLGPILFYAIQYGYFHATGYLFTEHLGFAGGCVILGIWLYPLFIWLPAAVLISRAIYKKTANPYLGGMIMALFITITNCANTITFF